MKTDIGIVGLGVMGKNLALNIADKGYKLSLFNRPEPKKGSDIAKSIVAGHPLFSKSFGFEELDPFVYSLIKPRIIILIITAGNSVDQIIEKLKPLLETGDVIIDGGNSHFTDTIRRYNDLADQGICFLGTGISGGEEGARKGPSIMAGGSKMGFKTVEKLFKSIAAKDKHGNACMNYFGQDGVGHFIKMVHNGIEYGEMQIIADCYNILKNGQGLNPEKSANVFEQWLNSGQRSFLLEITIKILRRKENNQWVIEKILDQATNKGTGNWTVKSACDLGVSVPVIAAALFERFQSVYKNDRAEASQLYQVQNNKKELDTNTLAKAYETARIINHHQGFELIKSAGNKYNWNINLSELAQTWTSGCIIQSELMYQLVDILGKDIDILIYPEIASIVKSGLPALADIVSLSALSRINIPALSASLSYYYSYANGYSAANLIQAQRDYFGAHGIQWSNDPSGLKFHYNWSDSKNQ